MILDYVDENEEEVWTFFKTSYSDGGIFGGETMTVSSPKTSYVYHYPTGSITLFTAGQVESDSVNQLQSNHGLSIRHFGELILGHN